MMMKAKYEVQVYTKDIFKVCQLELLTECTELLLYIKFNSLASK